jgi:YidC/Oxa1 family membrane protein insertase
VLRRMSLPLMLVLFAVTLTGCGDINPDGSLDRSGFWGKFVGFVSDSLDYFFRLTGDYGIAILLVTLVIRIIIFPLMVKQIRYQKVMQQLQPEMQKIREKYKNDKEKQSQETMKLFQQYGANPLSGCFPILLQMPILFALYRAIMTNLELQKHQFLGFMELHATQSLDNLVLAVLAAGTTYLQSRMTMTGNDPNTKMMLFIMPLMIAFFTYQFPAALGLYWVFGNILTIAQTYFTKGIRAPQPPAAGGKSK